MLVIMASVIGIYQGLTMIRLASISLRAVLWKTANPAAHFLYEAPRLFFKGVS